MIFYLNIKIINILYNIKQYEDIYGKERYKIND